jgi:hypothetical protein
MQRWVSVTVYVAYGLPPLALGVLCIAVAARWLRHH